MDYTKRPGREVTKIGEVINNEKPVVSIVTPFYNGGKTVQETANSVLSQTYPFFEWIIVDDGSKDEESLKKLKEIEKIDKRIKIYHKENGGPAVARDYGISKSSNSCKYVMFLDCDDMIDRTFIECLYWALETNPDAGFAYATLINFGTRESIWERYLTINEEKEDNLINICSMVRKEDLLEVGCFGIKEKAMYEDWNLWLKLIRAKKKPLRVSAPLFWYRNTDSGELSRAKENHEKAMKYIRETTKDIEDDQVEIIQYPRHNNYHATCKEYDMILPDYKKDKRTTILYFFPWMVVGGADIFNLELIKRLPQDKYRSIILTTMPSTNPIRQEFEEYAEVYDMSSFMDRINYINFADYIISSRKVDLVFMSNTEYGYYMTPYLKSKYPTIPFIDYIHSVDLKDPRYSVGRCSMDIDQYLYGTYCCNNFTKNQLKKMFNKKNVETVYIGTNPEEFDISKFDKESLKEKYNIPKDKKIISLVARISGEKRPLMFVEIAKKIHSLNEDTHFVIAGDGHLLKKVKKSVDENFSVLGMVNKPEEIYAISDITINCSSLEGLALSSYESLAMSVPVVSSDVGGQTELIDSSVGAIVHYNPNPSEYNHEIDEYVEKTLKVLNNLDKLKINCRDRIKKEFTLDMMAKKLEKIFKEALKSENKTKLTEQDKTIYELACEVFNKDYYDRAYYYYETYLGLNLIADTPKSMTLHRKRRAKLEALGILSEGQIVMEFVRAVKRLNKELKTTTICFGRAIYSSFKASYKVFKRIITKPFRR